MSWLSAVDRLGWFLPHLRLIFFLLVELRFSALKRIMAEALAEGLPMRMRSSRSF